MKNIKIKLMNFTKIAKQDSDYNYLETGSWRQV